MSVVPVAVDRTRRPTPAHPRSLELPRFETLDLANGLRVRFARRAGVPEVSLRLVLEAGAGADPARLGGLAELTARALTEGAGDRDAVEMARWLDHLGADFEATVGYDVTILSMHFLSNVLDDALEYLAAVTREPSFAEHEVDRLRGERLDEIERERDEPSIVADQGLIEALYPDGVYGRPVGGLPETVARLRSETLREFHSARYAPGGATLIACGEVRASELAAGLDRHFGDWVGACARTPSPTAPADPGHGRGVLLLDRPGSPQAELRVGGVGLPHGTDDHYAAIVANAILGGLFNSRINMNLREDKGWTYGARSWFRFRRGPGPFVARTAVETAVTADALHEILAEIERMRKSPPEVEELELAKNALTLSLPLQFETAEQVTRRVGRQLIFDLPADYWERFGARIRAVTPGDVQAVCRTYLDRERLILLAVTDADEVEEALGRLAPVRRRPAGESPRQA